VFLKISTSIKFLLLSTFFFLVACDSSESNQVNNSRKKKENEVKSFKELKKQEAGQEDKDKLKQKDVVDFFSKYGKEQESDLVKVSTDFGDITIRLYDNTPLHRANFLYLTEKDYFDSTWFYRVSPGHVIQAGNTDGRRTQQKRVAIGEYKIPAEMDNTNYHKRGAVGAVRGYRGNPEKYSDPFEWYISLGRTYAAEELQRLSAKHGVSFTTDQIEFYADNPGSPHLDGEHTVFGEVVEGMDVVEKINQVETDQGEWPMTNIPIKVEVVD